MCIKENNRKSNSIENLKKYTDITLGHQMT